MSNTKKFVSIQMSESDIEKLDITAIKKGISRSKLVRDISK